MIQGAQLGTGIMIVRLLGREEYALYFLAFSLVSMISVLTSSGLVAGFNRIAGPLVSKPPAFADALHTLLAVRATVLTGLLPIIGVLAATLFLPRGISVLRTGLLAAILLPYLYISVAGSVYGQAAKLTGKFNTIQLINLWSEVLKAVLVVGFGLLWPTAEGFLIAVTFPALLVFLQLKKFCGREGFSHGQSVPAWRAEYLKSYWALLPNSAYSAFQGQISAFLLGWVGVGGTVADLGAISRWGRATQPVNSYLGSVVSPALSRLTEPAAVERYFRRWLGLVLLGSFAVIGLFWLLTPVLLGVLGPNYTSLRPEFLLYSCGVALDLVIGYLVCANQARGYFHWSSRFQIVFALAVLVLGAIVFDVATLNGVILMSMLARVPILILQACDWVHGTKELAA